jgi:hypothetical protein
MALFAIWLLFLWAFFATITASTMYLRYEMLRRDYLKALENPQMPFVRALPPQHDNVFPIRREQ